MSVEGALLARLTTYAGITALASTRTYAMQLPQAVTFPAIRFQRVASSRFEFSAMGNDPGLARVQFQVDASATTFAGARALATQVREALQRYSATADGTEILDCFIQGESDEVDTELIEQGVTATIYRSMLQVEVIHRE